MREKRDQYKIKGFTWTLLKVFGQIRWQIATDLKIFQSKILSMFLDQNFFDHYRTSVVQFIEEKTCALLVLPATLKAAPTKDGGPHSCQWTQLWVAVLPNRLSGHAYGIPAIWDLNPLYSVNDTGMSPLLSSSLINPGRKKWDSSKEIYTPFNFFHSKHFNSNLYKVWFPVIRTY